MKDQKTLTILKYEPLAFKIVKWMQRRAMRGSYLLENIVRSMGLLNYKVRHNFGPQIQIDIPIATRPYDHIDLSSYEKDSANFLRQITEKSSTKYTLFDCGADIGLMSAKLLSVCSNIDQLIAFEPNATSFNILAENVNNFPIVGEAINQGVSDFVGKAELHHPEFDSHDHAAFIVPAEDGDISITTIDEVGKGLPNQKPVILKIDVEGGELSVLKGAVTVLSKAPGFIILCEAHYRQVERSGIDPSQFLQFVRSIKNCEAKVVEMPLVNVDFDVPFYEQFPKKIFNICIYSVD